MTDKAAFFARWRVRLGYPLALLVLFFSRPTPRSVLIGAIVGGVGLGIRVYAAGYLHKQEVLTVSGPYAYTRNPLYLGSAVLALATGLATRSYVSGILLVAYFALFYSVVMLREEQELRDRHGIAFDGYAQVVPLFFPRLWPARLETTKLESNAGRSFSLAQYRKNHEWQAALGFLFILVVLLLIWSLRAH